MTYEPSASRCQMFCTDLLDADADPVDPDGDFKNMCAACRVQLDHLCREVLPALRRDGFYAPVEATDDERLAAMVDQADARPQLREMTRWLDDVPLADGRTWGQLWQDPRWPDGPEAAP